VGGENFGCGSSREQACSTLKGYEVTLVARSIARIFLQNSINLGLKVVICPGFEAAEGDDLEITADKVLNRTSGKAYDQVQMPAARKGIMDAGGLIPYTRARLMAKA
jgi:3-isopropylmalate/(R)-2-methylmalate dehydratase small subunit